MMSDLTTIASVLHVLDVLGSAPVDMVLTLHLLEMMPVNTMSVPYLLETMSDLTTIASVLHMLGSAPVDMVYTLHLLETMLVRS